MILTEKFEVHNTLNPKLWDSSCILLPEVKQRILDIVDQFKKSCDIPLDIIDIHLVGSNASFNYTDQSDLDVHIVTNFELVNTSEELVQIVYNYVKSKFNADYDVSIHGVDVELYVEDVNASAISNGIYSVNTDSWIKFPKVLTSIPQFDLTDELADWTKKVNIVLQSHDADKIESCIDSMYLLRKNALMSEGEYSKGNQIFKELRNLGLLDKLKDAYKTCMSKELTLEQYLREDSRTSILSNAKRNPKGFERFKKRVKSRVINTVKQFNSIDMNKLFKQDILTIDVNVHGETKDYVVKISFGGFLELLHDQLEVDPILNLKSVTRALINGINKNDVYINCNCEDNIYRHRYWQTKTNIVAGETENRPANITNPHNDLGPSCKHILLVLSNTGWMLKVASTIFNYVNYMEKHYKRLYADVIYPAIYQKDFEEPVQMDIFDKKDLDTDASTIDASNEYAKTKNRFKTGNTQGVRFASTGDKNQLNIDDN